MPLESVKNDKLKIRASSWRLRPKVDEAVTFVGWEKREQTHKPTNPQDACVLSIDKRYDIFTKWRHIAQHGDEEVHAGVVVSDLDVLEVDGGDVGALGELHHGRVEEWVGGDCQVRVVTLCVGGNKVTISEE